MSRSERVRAAARKLGKLAESDPPDDAREIGAGVEAVVREIAPLLQPGELYWRGPLQFVVEQMAPRVCHHHGIPLEAVDDVRTYLLAGMNEYLVAFVSDFDVEHFAAWIGAQNARPDA